MTFLLDMANYTYKSFSFNENFAELTSYLFRDNLNDKTN